MKRLIRNTVIWLAAGAIFVSGTAAFCLVDLARTDSGNYPDKLLAVGEARAELMGEEIPLPKLPPQVQEAASAATALIPPEWRLLFKTALRAAREELAAFDASAVGAGAEAEIAGAETEADADAEDEGAETGISGAG